MRLLIIILLFSMAANGQQVAKTWVTPAGWTMGLMEYRPPGIDTMVRKPGLIIYSHGNGESSNYTTGQALTAAGLMDNNETPKLLTGGTKFRFQAGGTGLDRSFVVLSFARNTGQSPFFESGSEQYVDWALKYMRDSLATLVDTFRIYLVGISGGGATGWKFPGRSLADAQKLAAIVQVSATPESVTWCNIASGNLPIWAFHAQNDSDPTPPSGTQNAINAINSCGITPAPIFTNPATGGHNIWDTSLDTNYVGSNGMNVYEWLLQYTRDPAEQTVYPVGVRLYPPITNFYDLVQANKPLMYRLIDNDSSTVGQTDFFNDFIMDDYASLGYWIDLDTFINHPRFRVYNTNSGGVTVKFQFFYSLQDTTRHSPEYTTTLPETNWKWVDSATTREYDDSVRFLRVQILSNSANGFSEIEIYGNKLGAAPSILPPPDDEPPDPGAYRFQWYGKLFVDTLMDDAGGGQRIQNSMQFIYDETSGGDDKNIVYNKFANSTNLTLLPSQRMGLWNSTYFADIRIHHEEPAANIQRKDIVPGADSSLPETWQPVYDTYYGVAAKLGCNTSADVTGYTFRNMNAGQGQCLVKEWEINNEVSQHWNGGNKFHGPETQILQQRAGYYGVKDADPNSIVNLGALTGLREDRMKAYFLMALLKYKSADSIFFDQMSVNEYKTTAGQQHGEGDIDGMSPETWQYYERLNAFRTNIRDKYYPGTPLLITEDGYDTHDSEYNVTDIAGRTRRETQAHWVWRSMELCAAARWSRYVQYSQRDGSSGAFATTGFSYDIFMVQNGQDTLPAYMQQVVPPDRWTGNGWVSVPKEQYWWLTFRRYNLENYNAWPTVVQHGDSTGVWCLRYNHQTSADTTMLSLWMGTASASTTSDYQVAIPGAVSATLIHPTVGDKNGVESSLTVVNGVITIPTVWEGGDYVRVTLSASGPSTIRNYFRGSLRNRFRN